MLPPHSSHRLQPLDVALFKSLSTRYGVELDELMRRNQALTDVRKDDFIRLFWAAYTFTFTSSNISSSFAATGVYPRNADAVLKRLPRSTPQRNTDIEIRDHGDGDSYRQLAKLLDAAVPDTSSVAAKRVSQALHSLQVNNELLHLENNQLRDELAHKKRPKKHNKVLDLQQHQEYQSLAVVWSPRAVREARHRDAVKQQEEAEAKHQKQQDREDRARAIACRKRLEAAARVERQEARMAKAKEREALAAQLAAARARKGEQRAAKTPKKISRYTKYTYSRSFTFSEIKNIAASSSRKGSTWWWWSAASQPAPHQNHHPRPQYPASKEIRVDTNILLHL